MSAEVEEREEEAEKQSERIRMLVEELWKKTHTSESLLERDRNNSWTGKEIQWIEKCTTKYL